MAAVVKVRGAVVLPGAAAGAGTTEGVSWNELVSTVHRQMRSIAGPCRDLEDLTQSALERIVLRLPGFRGQGELSTFTYGICVHVAMNHWRWWRRWLRRFQMGIAQLAADSGDERPAPTQLTLQRERAEHLYECLERLAPAKRIVVTLSDLEELPAWRIAEIMQCPEGTVRSRLRQARRELSELLEHDPLFREDGEETP
jgi:RNA polymerase sigma-70 factor (ECF subfamily)